MATETLDSNGKVIGPLRGARAHKKWVPKKWEPVYESIVALSCTGLSNEEVGKRFGYGKQQVSNILNTPQAKKLKEIINERIRAANTNTITERMDSMANKAMKHIEFVLDRPTEDFKNPLAIFDRSLAFLKGAGIAKADTSVPSPTVNNIHNTHVERAMILNSDQSKLLNDGLKKADQVKVIHSVTDGSSKP